MSSLRWKLILTSLVTVFVPVFLLNRNAVAYFDRFTRTTLEGHMVEVAHLVGDLVQALPDDKRTNADALAESLGTTLGDYTGRTETRIRILSPVGVILLDSAASSLVGEDLSEAPEVATALQGTYKARAALTPDHQYMYYYCAQPILNQDTVACVVYVSRHTSPIVRAINNMRDHHVLATLSALALAALIASVFAHTLTRRLRILTQATAAFTRGDQPRHVQVGGRDEIGELARAYNRFVDELAQSESYNREFMSTTMHELRGPVTAIKGAAELLEQGAGEKPEARAKFLANIRYQSERLMRLTGELTELTRVDTEALRESWESVDYADIIRSIVDRLLPTLDEAHVHLRVHIQPTGFRVYIQPSRIEQVVSNLLENAFRFSPREGEVEIRVEAGPDQTVITQVRDRGDGIAAANLSKVFDRFFTTEPKDRYAGYGSGLGLSIARSIITQHRGTIWVESEPGQGACFSYSLPLDDRE